MTVLLVVFILLFLFGTIIFLTDLKLETSFIKNVFKIRIYIFKIKIFDNNKPEEKKSVASEQNKAEDNNYLKLILENRDSLITDLKELLLFLKHKASVKKFRTDITFGASDAAYTGVLTGDIWGLIGIVLPLIYGSLKFDTVPEINVNPVFNEYCFEISYEAVYKIKIITLIKAVFKIYNKYKNYKGGVLNVSTASN